jgi:multidrug efflux pump subunit AcrA (membrane-fusion protein)
MTVPFRIAVVLIVAVGTFLIGTFLIGTFAIGTAVAQPPAAPPIASTRVIEREVAAAQTFVATVRPTRTAAVGSAASGRVAEYFFEEGDRVKAMEPLAQLLTETISSEIEAAAAELKLRESELEELENGVRPEELEQAKARMLAAEARKEFTAMNRARVEALYKRGSSSVNERDQAVTTDIEAENQYIDAKASYDLAVDGPRPEKIAQAKAAAEMQAAVLQKLKDQKRKHTIISRFDGYVIREYTAVGSWVNTGDMVYEIAALDEVDVEAFVTEQQVANIRIGMEVDVEIPALGERRFPGVVKQIVPQADLKTRTFPVRIRVKNELIEDHPVIKAGMLARVQLPIGPRENALLVPKDSLVFAGSNVTVIVVTPDSDASQSGGKNSPGSPDKAAAETGSPMKGTVQPVAVELGVSQGRWIQIRGELKPGQLVVVEGNERLRPGQSVRVAEIRDPQSIDQSGASPGGESSVRASSARSTNASDSPADATRF